MSILTDRVVELAMKPFIKSTTVDRVDRIGARFVRLTLSGPDLRGDPR